VVRKDIKARKEPLVPLPIEVRKRDKVREDFRALKVSREPMV
jgi:hypothetical protein